MKKKASRKIKRYMINKEMKGKMKALVAGIIALLVILVVIVISINKDNGDAYAINVLDQQNYSSSTIPYKRGDIVDRNGATLATSIKVYNLVLDPKIILSDENRYYEQTLDALVECMGYNRAELEKIIDENKTSSYYVYKKKLQYDEIKAFVERKNDTKKYPYIQGVWFESEYERKYPFNSLACNVIGFVSAGNVGTWGIEEYYNEFLNGIDGRKYGYVNNDNIMEEVEKKAEDGNTIVSTIDMNIQSIIEKHIARYNEELDPEHIGIVIMNPKNGEVLGMAGKLSYDLNNPRDLTAFYKEDEIKAMNDEDKLKALNEIWRNYCISDSYEPGSTAKPYTIAAALDEGNIKAKDKYTCDGGEVVGGWTIKCHNNQGHGEISMYEAIAYSCNDALMAIAASEGAQTFTTYQKKFNFGLKTRIDLPGEESCASLVFSANDMKASDLATNSFGQNYNVTMIQVASAFSSLINGGYYYTPHVVKEIVNTNGGVVKSYDKTLVKQTVTLETSNEIKKGLRLCVEGGTGRTADVDGYVISGKTGTAEKYPRGNGKYLLSFIGFAPYDTPELVCYVVVDNPDVEDQSTTYATTLFKAVMEEVLAYMSVFPDDETYEEPETTTEAPIEIVTDENGNEISVAPTNPTEEETTTSPLSANENENFSGGIIDDNGESASRAQEESAQEASSQWSGQTGEEQTTIDWSDPANWQTQETTIDWSDPANWQTETTTVDWNNYSE